MKTLDSFKSVIEHIHDAVKSEHNKIIIDLWANGDRKKDIIPLTDCPHTSICDNVCQYCGSYIGIIGEESTFSRYVENIMIISSLLKHKEIVFITKKDIPTHLTSIGTIIRNVFHHGRRNVYSTRDNKYMMFFYPLPYQTKYSLEVTRLSVEYYLMSKYITYEDRVLWINPTGKVFKTPINNLDLKWSNSGVKL